MGRGGLEFFQHTGLAALNRGVFSPGDPANLSPVGHLACVQSQRNPDLAAASTGDRREDLPEVAATRPGRPCALWAVVAWGQAG